MELIPQWAPNVHPMLVHFPIAILSVAIFFDFISFFLSTENTWWTRKATAFLYATGAVSAIIVYYTGTLAADSVVLPADAQPVLSDHSNLALYTVWFYGIYAILRMAGTWWAARRDWLKIHIGFFLLSLPGMVLLYQTGDHGAELVFKHGVGVQAYEVENPVQHQHGGSGHTTGGHATGSDRAHHHPSDSSKHAAAHADSFHTMEGGGWSWDINKNAAAALQHHFQWLAGSADAVNAEAVSTGSGYALSFSGDDINAFFTGPQSFKSEQIDYYVNMSSLDGTVSFVSHVQDANNYDFMSISSDGTVQQGRVSEGETTVFEEGSTRVGKPLFVRVVGNGTHFRGYVNDELVVHGHGEAPPAGPVGLKVNGSGRLLLQAMSVTPLESE